MLNVAISNLLVCILILPFVIVSGYSSEFVFGSSDYVRCIFCSMGSANITLPMVSSYTLALISVGRLLYLKKPLRYSSIVTPARVSALFVIVWVVRVVSVVVALPPYFGFGGISFSYTNLACVPLVIWKTPGLPNVYYYLILVPIGQVSIAVLFVMYIWIVSISRQYILKNPKRFALLHKQFATQLKYLSKKGPGYDEEMNKIIHSANKQQQFRMVQVLGAIFLTNIITWIPMIVLMIASVFIGTKIPTFCYSFVYIFYLLEIILHPLLQIVLIYELKETVQRLWSSFKKTFCICFRSMKGV